MTELELLIDTRRDLHRHPELAFEERRTAAIAAERLRAAGYEVAEGVGGTGVIGTMRGGAGEGPTLLLRADMDALPIEEETSHAFPSTEPGKMHACGHDAHVAIGLAVAERLARRRARAARLPACRRAGAARGGGSRSGRRGRAAARRGRAPSWRRRGRRARRQGRAAACDSRAGNRRGAATRAGRAAGG